MRQRVLAAATSLLGVCLVIIVILKVTDQNARTYADEVAWVAAGLISVSILLPRSGRRGSAKRLWQGDLADSSFLIGSGALLVSLISSFALL